MALPASSTRRAFLRLAGVAAATPHALVPDSEEAKRRKPPPPPPLVPQAPFSSIEYQGPLPALLQNLPTYTDADVSALLHEHAADPQGLPSAVSGEAAAFTRAQLLRMVPRVLLTSARGGPTRKVANALLSPGWGAGVFGAAVVTQHRRSGANESLESRLAFILGQASRVRLSYTTPPPYKVVMAREDDGSTLVAYDPASTSAALSNPDGALSVRYRTSLGGGASAQYVWVNNLSGAYRSEAKSSAGRGARQDYAASGTPWLNAGHHSVLQLVHQILRIGLWNRNGLEPKYYDAIGVLFPTEGGYRDGGIGLQLLAFGVDWSSSGVPTFVPGHVRIDLTLTFPQDGPEPGKLQALTLSVNGESDFQGAAGVGVNPLFNPSAGEYYLISDPRGEGVQYNHPDIGQLVRTADMVALTKGVRNSAHPAWGVIPYRGL